MNDHEHDDLWELLGQARKPEVSPFFARNVLRAIREAETRKSSGLFAWLGVRWRYASAAGVVAALILAGVMLDRRSAEQASSVQVVRIAENPDYEVIADLDTLLASENNTLWLDESVSF